jgi:hypothetical protein
VAPDVRCHADATRREPNASRKESPRWFSKTGRTHAPPRWSFLVTPSEAWFDREANASTQPIPHAETGVMPPDPGPGLRARIADWRDPVPQ